MGVKIHSKIRKIEEILLNFLKIFRKTRNICKLGYNCFSHIFQKDVRKVCEERR